MLIRLILSFAITFTFTSCLLSQGFHFGPKGGLGVVYQQYNNSDRSPILVGHGDLYLESIDDDGKGSIYGSLGLHTRGSGGRTRNPFNNSFGRQAFKYQNVSLGAGIKKRLDISKSPVIYYQAGLRVEYTATTNLSEFDGINFLGTFPIETFVRKVNYGITVGGGFEYDFGKNFKPFLEINFMPDLSAQYLQAEDFQVNDPFTNTIRTIPARTVRNISIEVTLGLKFLREVIYVN